MAHIVPPRRRPAPTWDLNMVLTALLDPPFELLSSVDLQWLTWKVVFLVAVSSARRVSVLAGLSCDPQLLVFHKDKAVLWTNSSFLPKVISSFHLNQEIVLPSLCPDLKYSKEKRLHGLDVVRALRSYTKRTKEIRHSDSLFIIPSVPSAVHPASKATIARWIREAIGRAYIAKGKSPPFQIQAHSTRAMGASWA